MKSLELEQPDVFGTDAILEKLEALFFGKIGEKPSPEEIASICTEGDKRLEKNIPPGYKDYKDGDKDRDFYHEKIPYNSKYGDLILWKQIIERAKNKNIKYLIFITDDNKEDWWLKVKGKTVGARPELTNEIRSEAGVELFYMYNSERFASFAKEYLSLKISDISLQTIHNIRLESRENNIFLKGSQSPIQGEHHRRRVAANLVNIKSLEQAAKVIMKDWFFENFIDPVHCCPYDSSEGGYIYIYGGPHDAEEMLYEEFESFYREDLINEVVEEVQQECIEWSCVPREDDFDF